MSWSDGRENCSGTLHAAFTPDMDGSIIKRALRPADWMNIHFSHCYLGPAGFRSFQAGHGHDVSGCKFILDQGIQQLWSLTGSRPTSYTYFEIRIQQGPCLVRHWDEGIAGRNITSNPGWCWLSQRQTSLSPRTWLNTELFPESLQGLNLRVRKPFLDHLGFPSMPESVCKPWTFERRSSRIFSRV